MAFSLRGACGGMALALLAGATVAARAQLPDRPRNLRVLSRDLTTDSVFALMLGVADALGTTCGHCHVGGDNRTWDSTNFGSDSLAAKRTARAMFAMVERLNRETLPPMVTSGAPPLPVTCVTCHRGALRPLAIEDTLGTVLNARGIDSVIATNRRIREQYAGSMTYDLREFPLDELSQRLTASHRDADAVKLLEEASRLFPSSPNIPLMLGAAYEKVGNPQGALAQYYKVLSINPTNRRALGRVQALTAAPKPPARR